MMPGADAFVAPNAPLQQGAGKAALRGAAEPLVQPGSMPYVALPGIVGVATGVTVAGLAAAATHGAQRSKQRASNMVRNATKEQEPVVPKFNKEKQIGAKDPARQSAFPC